MRPLVLSLVLAVPFTARADTWWGVDKALHFSVSVGLSAGGYAASSPFFEARSERALLGIAAAWTIGVAKEVVDAFGAGDPSLEDLAWDFGGCLVGAVLAVMIDRWIVTPLLGAAQPSS